MKTGDMKIKGTGDLGYLKPQLQTPHQDGWTSFHTWTDGRSPTAASSPP